MIKTHLDKIDALGFDVVVSWNNNFQIFYDVKGFTGSNGVISYPISILYCNINSKDFEEISEMCFDIFYEWYALNSKIIYDAEANGTTDTIESIVIGNVTKSIMRELKLDKLL